MNEEQRKAQLHITPPQIVRYLPELLAGIWSMSVPPETVFDLFEDEEYTHEISNILDLGCGKGAISINLARQFGFKVHGIDIVAAYLEEAGKRAKELGVGDTCRFEHGDISWVARGSADHDLVIMVWIGGVLGSLGQSVRRVRRLVRPGGYMLFGEGCLKDGIAAEYPFQSRFIDIETTRRELTMHGDVIRKELKIPQEKIDSYYREYIDSLRKGAEKCSRENPEHAGLLKEYVSSHEEMCKIMEETVDSYLWIVKKGKG